MARHQSPPKKNKGNTAPVKKENERVRPVARTAKPGQPMSNWMIGLILLMPLLYTDVTQDPMVPVRYIFMTVFLLLFVIYFFVFRKKIDNIPVPGPVKLVYGLAIGFGIWSIVSAMGALNPREGYFEIGRHFLNIIFLFAVMATVIREEPSIFKICKVLVIAALIQSMVGIFQYYDIGFTKIPGDITRPAGLMANRNLFGSGQAFLIPFCAYILYKGNQIWKWIAGTAILLLYMSVFLSQTRSAWLASIAVMLVSLFLILIFSKPNRKKWLISSVAAVAGIVIIVLLILASDTEGTLKKSTIERTASLTTAGVSGNEHAAYNAQERLRMWKKTLAMVKDDPITGTGPGNWRITIPRYGSEGMSWYYGQYTPDRPHNVYLLVTSETGIPGALLYFGTWILIVILGFKVIRKPQSEDQRVLAILMVAGLAALASDSMFSFPTERLEHSMYIYIMAGVLLGLFAKNAEPVQLLTEKNKKPILWFATALLLFNLFIGFKKYKFEDHFKQAKAYEVQKNWRMVIDEVEKGKNKFITLGPDVSTPLELRSAIAYKELKEYDNSLREVKIAEKYHPYNSRCFSTEGTVYTEMGQFEKAIECYEKGLAINPMYDVILKNLAINYFMAGNYKASIETLGKLNLAGDQMFTQLLKDAQTKLAEQGNTGTMGK